MRGMGAILTQWCERLCSTILANAFSNISAEVIPQLDDQMLSKGLGD